MASSTLRLFAAVALPAVVSASGMHREGENLLTELADAVIGNKQELLPIPFDMVLERDVGYVGEYPLKANSTAVAKAESLGTFREVNQSLPSIIAIASVYIKDSNQPPSPPSGYRMGETVGGHEHLHLNGVVNPTSELTVWQWQRIKFFAMQEWLDKIKIKNPDRLVILHSAGDVLYGGCDEASIKYKYNQIVTAAGGTQKIVLAAEVAPYPSGIGWKYSTTTALNTAMTKVLNEWSLSASWAKPYAKCAGTANSICDSTPKYQYANSGFIMGPASDVRAMLAGLAQFTGVDNQHVNEYFLEHPDKVTLDYAGILSLSLHGLVKDGKVPVEVDSVGNKSLKNKVTGQKVCFVHGNGNSFAALKTLAEGLKA